MKLNKSLFLLFICMCCFTGIISAQKTWEKPLDKWGKDDALKIVTDSPWAKTYQSPNSTAAASAQQVAREQRDSVYGGGGGSTLGSSSRSGGLSPVVIRLHSALPVRQAIVRGMQINAKYDKMDDKAKAEFDASVKGFLACAICQNYYVISLTQFPDKSGQSVQEGIFQRFTVKDLIGNLYLVNDKGEQRELVQFNPPKGQGDSAYFFFARKDDKGNLLITPDTENFKLVFKNDFLTSSNPYAAYIPRSFDFTVSKMKIGEKIEF